jgi:hypothetical protein
MGMSPRHMRLSERNWRGVICCEMSGRDGSDSVMDVVTSANISAAL